MGPFDWGEEDSLVNRIKESYRESREELQKKQEEAASLQKQAEGQSINESTMSPGLVDLFDEDELPHHAVYGKSLKIEGGDETREITGEGAQKIITFATNQRILIRSQSGFTSGKHTIPYDAVDGVDYRKRMVQDRIVIQTSGRTYYSSCAFSDHADIERFVEYIRGKREDMDTGSIGGSQSVDPAEQIDKLNQLMEKGAISEEEFQEKKEELLDRI